jgi:hypothetical protein
MSKRKLTEYSLEMYKTDGRIKKDERYGKNKVGLRFYDALDLGPTTRDYVDEVAEAFRRRGFIVQVFETFVTRTNMMSGQEFQERYDRPYYCSPSSETYWSM